MWPTRFPSSTSCAPRRAAAHLRTYVRTADIARKLTLNLGLRYNYDNGYVAEGCRDAADPPGDVPNPAQCFDKVPFKISSLSPRVRAAYDLAGNGKRSSKAGGVGITNCVDTDELQTATVTSSRRLSTAGATSMATELRSRRHES